MKKIFSIFAMFIALANLNAMPLINEDLSNTYCDSDVWAFDAEGALSADEDIILWTKDSYENFIIEAEFKVAEAGNGGFFIYVDDPKGFTLADSIEVQLSDNDYWTKKLRQPYYTATGAIFGIQSPYMDALKPLEMWNKVKISCEGKHIQVWINGRLVNHLDLDKCTSASVSPDGNVTAPHLRERARATFPTKGHIGLQGKHSKGKVFYRNINISPIEAKK